MCAELEVARMSTDGNLPDLKFPQTGGQGNSIHLSANTLKQHGRNGESSNLLSLLGFCFFFWSPIITLKFDLFLCPTSGAVLCRLLKTDKILHGYSRNPHVLLEPSGIHNPVESIKNPFLFFLFFSHLDMALQGTAVVLWEFLHRAQ